MLGWAREAHTFEPNSAIESATRPQFSRSRDAWSNWFRNEFTRPNWFQDRFAPPRETWPNWFWNEFAWPRRSLLDSFRNEFAWPCESRLSPAGHQWQFLAIAIATPECTARLRAAKVLATGCSA